MHGNKILQNMGFALTDRGLRKYKKLLHRNQHCHRFGSYFFLRGIIAALWQTLWKEVPRLPQ